MKAIILLCALLLAAIPAKADEAPTIIRLSPGVFSITEHEDGSTSVLVIDGWTLVSMEVTNTGLEPILGGDHGANSGGVTGACSLEFFLGATDYPVCEEFAGAEFLILPGETTYVPFMYLFASDWVEPGFGWQEDMFLYTNAGTFQSSFTGFISIPDPNIYRVTETPEPGTLLLLGTGLVGVGAKLRRRITRRKEARP